MNCIPTFLLWVLHIVKKGVVGELNMSDFSALLTSNPEFNATITKEKLKLHHGATQLLNKKHSLLFAIWRTFKFQILFCLTIRILDRCFLIAFERILLGKLLEQIRASSECNCQSWIFLAFLIIATLRCITQRTVQYLNKGIAMRIHVGVLSLLYNKILRLSQNSLRQTGPGDLVNLISKGGMDLETSDYILALITGPLQLVSELYVLWIQFGASAGIGVAIIIVIGCWQTYLGIVSTKHRCQIAVSSGIRARLMTQVLLGIKTIKTYALEDIFLRFISEARKKETNELKKLYFLEGLRYVTGICCALIALIATVSFHELFGKRTSREQIIVASTIFYQLRTLIFFDIRNGVKQFASFINSVLKFQEVLLAEEIVQVEIYPGSGEIDIEGLALNSQRTYSANSAKFIADLNLRVVNPELIVITGTTGVGKSSLLKAILGEFPITEGKIKVGGRVSYATQEIWIFAGTIRDNILFHSKYESKRYDKVLLVCALLEDLSSFQGGDQTILEEGGARLSGGQKTRISLARAVYREAEIYLLDDILSNVDSKVGTHILHRCINGFLKNKIRILVTSNAISLNGAGKHYRLQNGTLVEIPSATPIAVSDVHSDTKNELRNITQNGDGSCAKRTNFQNATTDQIGVYWQYLTIGSGYAYFLQYLIFTGVLMLVYHGTEYLLQQSFQNPALYKLGFNHAGFGCALLLLIFGASAQIASLLAIMTNSSQHLHNGMLNTLLRAPLQFFSQRSPGEILERFTTGMSVVDESLPFVLYGVAQIFLMYLSGYSVAVYKFGVALTFPVILLFTFGALVQKWNIKICQQLTNLSHLAKDPITSRLVSTTTGITTIRALRKIQEMEAEYDKFLNLHFWINYIKLSVTDSATLLIDLATVGILNILVIASMFLPHFGIEMTFSSLLSFGATVGCGFSLGTILITNGKHADAILKLHKIPQEIEDAEHEDAPEGWPWKGKIVFSNVCVAYEPSNPVLKHISFTIKPGENIAIIGRTGCGKSTLISALSRLVEASGDILIDGLNISKVSLKSLRRSIAIIPQDPYFFQGTLRFCLDPFQQFGDAELLLALRTVHMLPLVGTLPNGLQTEIGECGNIFSAGQRQLLSLASAILRKPKVLVMDESTASVDGITSHTILSEIMRNLPNSTVVTILHRLTFINSYDRVMVIQEGEIVEFAPPCSLKSKFLQVSLDD